MVTLDGAPDLTNVTTDGTSVLWMQTSTGRQFFTINAKDNGADTVTLDDAPAGTTTGRTWGIGGKRQTIDETNSRLLFTADLKASWIVSIEYTGTNYTVSSNIACVTQNYTIRGNDAANLTCLEATHNGTLMTMPSNGAYVGFIQNLKFINTNVTKSSGYGLDVNNWQGNIVNCQFGSYTASEALYQGIHFTESAYMLGCDVVNCESTGVSLGSLSAVLDTCYICDNGLHGISGNEGPARFMNCIIADNAQHGLVGDALVPRALHNCTFEGNGSDGLRITYGAAGAAPLSLVGNIFSNNGGYGADVVTATGVNIMIRNNNYYNNTSGARNNVPTGTDDTTLDPQYTAAASGDYRVGANMKGKGWPPGGGKMTPLNRTPSYLDNGASQREESVGTPNYGDIYVECSEAALV